MRHRSTKAVHAYWDNLRGQDLAPARTAVDPRGIAAMLGDVFLLEFEATGFRFRLAGSRMVSALGRPLTGTDYATLWLEQARARAERALADAATDAEPVLVGVRTVDIREISRFNPPQRPKPGWWNFRDVDAPLQRERRAAAPGAGEMLLLPLKHQGRIGTRILGALAFFEAPLVTPETALPLDITSTRFLGRRSLPPAGTEFAGQRTPDDEALTGISRRGHLVVIPGNRPATDA